MLIGNKSDMTSQRVISPECGQQIAIEHSIPFLETSAKTNTNIDKAFYYMAEAIMNNVSFFNEEFLIESKVVSNFNSF